MDSRQLLVLAVDAAYGSGGGAADYGLSLDNLGAKTHGSEECSFFSSRRRHTRYWRDWSSDVCSSDLWLDSDARRSLLDRSASLLVDEGTTNVIEGTSTEHSPQDMVTEIITVSVKPGKEIGRASCRERVQISVVAVSL